VSTDKLALIDKARKRWISELIDVSRRNRLLYFRETQGSVNFTNHDPVTLAKLLGGEKVSLQRLLKAEITPQVETRLHKIQKNALTNLEEKGLDTLFLILGMTTWTASDGGTAPNAPILLVPLQIEVQGVWRSQRATLQRSGDIQVNSVLIHELQNKFGVIIDTETLLSESAKASGEDDPVKVEAVFESLRNMIGVKVKAFSIRSEIYLSNMAYQKMAMVEDLQKNTHALNTHPLIAALAGDEASKSALRQNRVSIEPHEIDKISPDQEYLVLDADSSQQTVIATVLKGHHLVIQGPPGTGKSQTIANLISTLVARGKKVLFVAEKRAALEVVVNRLEREGLGHLCLDLHSADLSTRNIIRKLANTRTVVSNALSVNAEEVHRKYTTTRKNLNEYAEVLHQLQAPLGMSVYTLQGKILGLSEMVRFVRLRLQGADLLRMEPENTRTIRGFIQQLADLSDVVLRLKNSAWVRVPFSNSTEVEKVLSTVQSNYTQTLQLVTMLEQFCNQHQLRMPNSISECGNFLKDLQGIGRITTLYSPQFFERSLSGDERILSSGKNALLGAIAFWINSSYRRTRQEIQKLHESNGHKRFGAGAHYRNVQEARQYVQNWQEKWAMMQPLYLAS